MRTGVVAGRSTRSLEGIGTSVANQPRYRDGAIVMFIAGVIGLILGLDIGVRAVSGLPETWDTVAWSIAVLISAVTMFFLGSRILKRAKEVSK